MSILLFLLASASENSEFFDRNYSWLVGVNILVAFSLLILVVWMLIRLINRYSRGKFGSKLMTRLVVLFALMGILPGAVIYVVSVQFVSRSIESWFDVRVESALDSGVKLAQSILETSKEELTVQANRLANELAGQSLSEQTLLLTRFRNDNDNIEAIVVNSKGHLVATSGTTNTSLVPELPSAAMLHQVRMTSLYSAIEGEIDDPSTIDRQETDLMIRVIVGIPVHSLSVSLQNEPYYLQLLQKTSPTTPKHYGPPTVNTRSGLFQDRDCARYTSSLCRLPCYWPFSVPSPAHSRSHPTLQDLCCFWHREPKRFRKEISLPDRSFPAMMSWVR